MKGRANNKPDAKYHPHIIELLRLPLVTGIRGGGYAAEQNFALSDLPKAIENDLVEQKPELGSFLHRFHRNGMTDDLAREISDLIGRLVGPLVWDAGLEQAEVARWANISAFIMEDGGHLAIWAVEAIKGQASSVNPDDGAALVLRGLPDSSYKKIVTFLKDRDADATKRWEEDWGGGFSWKRPAPPYISAFAEAHHSDIFFALEDAAEAGALKAVQATAKRLILNDLRTYQPRPGVKIVLEDDKNPFGKHNSVRAVINAADIVSLASDEDALDDLGAYGWIKYRFNLSQDLDEEYDAEHAVATFLTAWPQFAPDPEPEIDITGWRLEVLRANPYTGQRDVEIYNPDGRRVAQRYGARGSDEDILRGAAKDEKARRA
jgi:hypothetical protein